MVKTIQNEEFAHIVNSGEEFIPINVISREDYEDIHLTNAIRCPVEEIGKWAEENPDKKDKRIVVYCGGHICSGIEEAANILGNACFTNVCIYEGTMQELWNAGLVVYRPGVAA